MPWLIGNLIALATILLAVSLPFGKSGVGRALRQWALAAFLGALLPSVACGLLRQTSPGGGAGRPGGSPLGALLGLAFLSLLAYVILKVRARLARPARDAWTEYVGQRSSGKRVVDDRDRGRRDDTFPL